VSLGYRVMYRLGITPWDHDNITDQLTTLIEGPDALPVGNALDIGCGGGRDARYLAHHGWAVTGVDVVPRALDRARRRAHQAGVSVRWVQADITAADAIDLIGLGERYSLVLDFGCVHGLTDPQRQRAAATIDTLADPGATLLMFAFQPGRRGPAPRGIDRAELHERFPGWTLSSIAPASDATLPGPLRNAQPTWYQLTKH
jgi:SAM-dependent methyltransferase